MSNFILSAIPSELQWENHPLDWKVEPENRLAIMAGERTDWFIDPAGNYTKDSSPRAMFVPPDTNFLLSAKISVDFASIFDAGGLLVQRSGDLWAKLCFEYSQQREPTIVSVVTRGISDDCNSVVINSREIYLRITHGMKIIAFHYSTDGRYWHLVRYFTLGEPGTIKAGFLSQSPTGQGCLVGISEISYSPGVLKDYRSGE